MNNKRKAILFAVLAAVAAAGTAPLSADQTISHIFLVLPLIAVAVLLFFAGYYVGLARNLK